MKNILQERIKELELEADREVCLEAVKRRKINIPTLKKLNKVISNDMKKILERTGYPPALLGKKVI